MDKLLLKEKKFLGSGGYVYAKLTEQEEIKANLEVAHLFRGNEGRLSEDRFSRYYGNKKIFLLCNKPSSAGSNQ